MHPFTILNRLVMVAITAAACLWLTSSLGPWAAIGIWAGAIGLVCAATAFLLRLQPPERITLVNRFAGLVLPWGYTIGRGRLAPIVIESSLRWVLLGAAIIIVAPRGLSIFGIAPAAVYPPGPIMASLLLLSWAVVAALFFRMATFVVNRSIAVNSRTLTMTFGLAVLLIASVAVFLVGRSAATTWLALALTGGPVLVLGGGFGVVLLIVLTVGRNARWH